MKMLLALAAIAIVSAVPAAAQTQAWERIAGARSAIAGEKPTTAVARTSEEWKTLWARHTGEKAEPAPAVDFEKEMVVAVFLGRRPRAGYAVECKLVPMAADAVDAALGAQGPSLVVFYKEVTPKGGFGGEVLTAPFELRKVKRYPAVSFEPETLFRARAALDTLRAFKDQPRFER